MENSDGLFQLTCECNNVYAPELGKCPTCDKNTTHQKALNLDYQKFFEKIISLQNDDKKDSALDVVFDVFFNLWNRYDIMNNILKDIPVDKLSPTLMVGLLSNTFKYADKLPDYLNFCDKSFTQMRLLGKPEDEIEEYIRDFRNVDVKKHWDNMKALGVSFPNMIFGPGPGETNESS